MKKWISHGISHDLPSFVLLVLGKKRRFLHGEALLVHVGVMKIHHYSLSNALLVGGFNHLEKYEFVNGKDDIPYIIENKSHV